jgi:hypothetical protein
MGERQMPSWDWASVCVREGEEAGGALVSAGRCRLGLGWAFLPPGGHSRLRRPV